MADTFNATIRKIVVGTGQVSTLAGSAGMGGNSDGTGAAARFALPYGLAVDGAGSVFVADTGNHTIRRVLISTGQVTTLAGLAGAAATAAGISASCDGSGRGVGSTMIGALCATGAGSAGSAMVRGAGTSTGGAGAGAGAGVAGR